MWRRRLRRQCKNLLRSIEFPHPFDIGELCRHLGERRDRPIRLVPIALAAEGPCGLLMSTPGADYVFYDSDTSAMHQVHVIAHELGHLLWNHESRDAADGGWQARHLMPDDLDPVLVWRMLGRTQYADPEEWAAEYFATQLLRKVSEWSPRPPSVPPEMAELVGRLERCLHPRRDGAPLSPLGDRGAYG
ncbi:ImmA/IrrE family metallo-endopeptidase [Streptomyces sp. NPDC048650]|uniref:ImmA/IrrE family metallo-endopeptidase n=1 Tax=unclassified Streptomyces TaxID=2593676 RepID=UPI003720060F